MKEMKYGKVNIKLEQLMNDQKLSINKLSQAAGMQRYQLKRYIHNEIQRIDLQILARLCCILECSISDILEYTDEEN